MSPRAIVGGVVFVALVAGTSRPIAQTPSAAPASDALLLEVRALRAELNQAAGTSIRTQLLVARLQLQEQRINSLAKQLDEARTLLNTLPSGLLPMQNELKQIEAELRNRNATPEQRDEADGAIALRKARIADMQRQIAALTDKESMLSAALASEQGRWYDFNTRLDDIERELSSKRVLKF